MGYFSQLAITLAARAEREKEPSFSPRDRLVDRIRDLTDRLEELIKPAADRQYATYNAYADRSLQNSILRYVLPEDLLSYDEVQSALLLAENDLWKMDQKEVTSIAFLIPGQMFLQAAVMPDGRFFEVS